MEMWEAELDLNIMSLKKKKESQASLIWMIRACQEQMFRNGNDPQTKEAKKKRVARGIPSGEKKWEYLFPLHGVKFASKKIIYI